MAATLTISLSALLLPVPTTAQATLPPLENLEPQLADERVLGPLDAPRGEIERIAKARAILEDSLGNAPETDPRIEEARAILEDQLVDYAGARFKNMHIVETGEALTLCGEVNAPNRLGGMSGWQKTAVILRGRDYVTPDDVKAIAPDVLRHRVITTYEAEAEEVTSDMIVKRVLDTVPTP